MRPLGRNMPGLLAAVGVLASVSFAIASQGLDLAAGTWRLTDSTASLAIFVAFSAVGAVISWQRPRNTVGWLFLSGSVLLNAAAFADAYGRYGLTHATLSGWAPIGTGRIAIGFAGAIVLFFVPYVYPTGKTLGRRWSVLVVSLAAILALGVIGTATSSPVRRIGETLLADPLYLESLRVPAGIAVGAGAAALVGLAIGALISVVVRLRRSHGVERQQIRWFVYACVVAITWIVPYGPLLTLSLIAAGVPEAILYVIYPLPLLAVPIATAVAILRYRLFDLDRLINGTLAYGIATAVIVALFGVLSVAAQAGLTAIVGQRVELATVVTAVVAGATFQPLRGRAQRIADRILPPRAHFAIVFTDIVGSTDKIAELGDQMWRDVLARYYAAVRAEVRRHGGHEVSTTGDGFFLIFPEPRAAVVCAIDIGRAVSRLGLTARTGVHVGEVDVGEMVPTGLNVHLASRVMSAATSGGVFISGDVYDLVPELAAGFTSQGVQSLKGIPRPVELFGAIAS